nr:MAG TPA: hypothetical protein [Caudoviricetes sp.]
MLGSGKQADSVVLPEAAGEPTESDYHVFLQY